MEKSVRLKICTGDKRHFGDDITNLGPLIPLKSPEGTQRGNRATSSKGPLKNLSAPFISDENEEPVEKIAKKSKNFFAHEKYNVGRTMQNLRQFLNKKA